MITYEIDPYNRLVINKKAKPGASKYRLSLDGYFKSGKAGSLQYHIKTPYKYRSFDRLPYRITLKGHYSLTKDHDILFTLRRSHKQRSEGTLLLKGDIIYVKENSIGFAVTTKSSSSQATTRTLSLNGSWRMDNKKQILFKIEKGRGKYDTLTFTGGWIVNKQNEIEYVYKKTLMKSKEKREERLTFKGSWEVIDNNRINYSLGLKNDSGFELEASLARAGFLGKKNALIYKLGTGISGKGHVIKTIAIYGKWKLTRRTGLLFEVRYSGKRRSYLSFGAEVRLNKRDELLFLLKDKKNNPLGIEIALRRRFLGNSGQALLKLLASKEERSVQLNVGKLF